MKINEIKDRLSPIQVVQYYLGSPSKVTNNAYWYKSPFRNERTASFCVNNEKGIHDFGTGKHYDIISFVQELFRIDFKSTMNKLLNDFGIYVSEDNKEVQSYYLQRRKQEQEIKQKIEKWFYKTYSTVCDELHFWQKMKDVANDQVLKMACEKIRNLNILANDFVKANEFEEQLELWRRRDEIGKIIR